MNGVHGNIIGPDIHLVGHNMVQMFKENQMIGHILKRCRPVFPGLKIADVDQGSQPAEDLGLRVDFPLPTRICAAENELPGSLFDIFGDKIRFEFDPFFGFIDLTSQVCQQLTHLFQFNLDADLRKHFKRMPVNGLYLLGVQHLQLADFHCHPLYTCGRKMITKNFGHLYSIGFKCQ